MIVQWYGLMGEWLSQWSAKPSTAVRIRFRPPERYLFGNAFFVFVQVVRLLGSTLWLALRKVFDLRLQDIILLGASTTAQHLADTAVQYAQCHLHQQFQHTIIRLHIERRDYPYEAIPSPFNTVTIDYFTNTALFWLGLFQKSNGSDML